MILLPLGVHTWPDGKVYKGQYENGYEHGFGTLTQADGVCRYRGNFRFGKRHGVGTQVWLDKNYEGEWKENALCGKGKLSWKNGTMYQGDFFQGRYHGQGILVNGTTGRKYVGSFVQGQKQGQGIETWPQSGESYQGSYEKGLRHGFGRFTMGDGSHYVGGWVNGERSGCGIHVASNGDGLHCGPLFDTTSRASPLSLPLTVTQSSSSLFRDDFSRRYLMTRTVFHDDMDIVVERRPWFDATPKQPLYRDDMTIRHGAPNSLSV